MYNVIRITKVSESMKEMGYSDFETLVGEFTHPIDAKYFSITEGFQFKSPTYKFEIRKAA
jgi:hypothetical protein